MTTDSRQLTPRKPSLSSFWSSRRIWLTFYCRCANIVLVRRSLGQHPSTTSPTRRPRNQGPQVPPTLFTTSSSACTDLGPASQASSSHTRAHNGQGKIKLSRDPPVFRLHQSRLHWASATLARTDDNSTSSRLC